MRSVENHFNVSTRTACFPLGSEQLSFVQHLKNRVMQAWPEPFGGRKQSQIPTAFCSRTA
jgi:hypothetical protein